MARVIDIHGHVLNDAYRELLARHDALFEDGFPLPSWSEGEALAFMDEAGIDLQVLSLSSPQPHFGDDDESVAFCREFNEWCADVIARHDGRFVFVATLPLPCVEAACDEAERAVRELGAVGVALPSNARGLYLGDALLEPLMSVLDGLGALALIHPHKPASLTPGLFTSGPVPLYEFIADTTRATLNLLAADVPLRYSGIRFVVPHTGSFLSYVIERITAVQPMLTARDMMPDVDIHANLSRLYFDLAGITKPELLNLLLSITTPDHLLYGSDYPFTPVPLVHAGMKRLHSMGCATDIMGNNAAGLLGL